MPTCLVQTCATDAPSDVVFARSDSQIEDGATATSRPSSIYERATAVVRLNGNRSRDVLSRNQNPEQPFPPSYLTSTVRPPRASADRLSPYGAQTATIAGLLLAPPSPTARSAVSQPAATAMASTGTTTAAIALDGGGDSEATRVSLWAELNDVRRCGARTPGIAREQQHQPSLP